MEWKVALLFIFQASITLFALYSLWSTAASARECQQSLHKAVVLLTVMANQQGATQADVENALGK